MSAPSDAPLSPAIDFVVASELWRHEPDCEALIRRAISAAAMRASSKPGELAIVLADDSAVRAFNKQWRGRDEPTNVLSFPAAAHAQAGVPFLGDIVIAFETAKREAAAEGKPFDHHLAHLVVHGYLHLLGHDHATEREGDAMERLEVEILAQLGIPDPYIVRPAEA
jgi:probable rRNA maturation factor